MRYSIVLSLLVSARILRPPNPIHAFAGTSSLHTKCRFPDDSVRSTRVTITAERLTTRRQSRPSSRLFVDLWERMEIEEDEDHEWYLINCIAGLEMDLLSQCRSSIHTMPSEDVVKFVVPTVMNTRSHGANRMVRETKVKYQGYVFAKLRLTKETYVTIQKIPLVRSWMGTINVKGHKKLPPAPIPLSEEEIENFDLENSEWEENDQGKSESLQDDKGIIIDTIENDLKESREEEAIEKEIKLVYKDLKVEDMIKVTAKNKFLGEDGMVRRLKEGRVLIRFFTYGTTYEEWLDPTDVRKLTEIEILKGLGGPGKPITQRDIDGPKEDDRRRGDDQRNQVGQFGRSPDSTRNRRQDRVERSYQKDAFDPKKERDNWNWFKENDKKRERKNDGGAYDDGDGVEFRAGSEDQRSKSSWAESDVDSQWGRNNRSPQKRQKENRRVGEHEDDWSSFVSKSSPGDKTKQNNNQPIGEETDDFFSSLLSDLSKDMDGNEDGRRTDEKGGQKIGDTSSKPTGQDSDDDFFALLMSEIENEAPASAKSTPPKENRRKDNDDDDFFASLEKEIGGSNNKDKFKQEENLRKDDDDDDFFASLEREIGGSSSTNTPKTTKEDKSKFNKKSGFETRSASSSNENDFFANLESELASDLNNEGVITSEMKEVKKSSVVPNGNQSPDDDFFSSLEHELRSDLESEENEAPILLEIENEAPSIVTDIKTSFDATSLQKRTVPQLKDILRDRGLKLSGKKSELINRITASV